MATITLNIEGAGSDTYQLKALNGSGNPYLQFNPTTGVWEKSDDGSATSSISTEDTTLALTLGLS
tara:strand:+ start:1149 stop:1343 length:195 start_codon:yes stop_codon:yes gene_type:complete